MRSTVDSITYSEFVAAVEKSDISDVTIQGSSITGHDKDGRAFSTYAPDDPGLVQRLHAKGVRSAKGLPILHPVGYYTLNEIPPGDLN